MVQKAQLKEIFHKDNTIGFDKEASLTANRHQMLLKSLKILYSDYYRVLAMAFQRQRKIPKKAKQHP